MTGSSSHDDRFQCNAGANDLGVSSTLAQIDRVNGAFCMTGHFVSHVRERPNGSRPLHRW
jgi:hypothetical protein